MGSGIQEIQGRYQELVIPGEMAVYANVMLQKGVVTDKDKFRQDLKAAGMEELVAIYQGAYDRYCSFGQ